MSLKDPDFNNWSSQKSYSQIIFYRLSQFIAFLIGARVFVVALLTFALYVSTFFLFNQEESLRDFVFDFKIHGIIFCAILSILAGGVINQFYDREKDSFTRPFRSNLQRFLKQKYFLYSYLILNTISLTISWLISPRVFVFFLIYQFFIWFYSHKLSRLLMVNNLTFVGLTLYPFFGMLVYYRTFSMKVFLMAIFLFLILLKIDVVKDILTKRADETFGYRTLANTFGNSTTRKVLIFLMILNFAVSMLLVDKIGIQSLMSWYFVASEFCFIGGIILLNLKRSVQDFYLMNILRFWIFIGIIFMLLDGILTKY